MTSAGWPKISIVTPSYNQGEFLEETICSVLEQNYPNLEYIVIDGGSTDNSAEIIKKYEKYIAYWVSEKDKGQADAINKGFSKATGEIFAWLNSDDMYYPGTLHKVARYWIANPSCHFLAGDGELVKEDAKAVEYYMKSDHFDFHSLLKFYQRTLPQPSVFFSREAFRRASGLNASLNYAMDQDLWLNIIDKYPLHYLPTCLSRLRHHHYAKTFKRRDAFIAELKDVVKKRYDSVNVLERFCMDWQTSLYHSKDMCRRGILEYLNRNRNEAIKLLKRAICLNPAVIFSFIGISLISRIILPGWVKKYLFKRP